MNRKLRKNIFKGNESVSAFGISCTMSGSHLAPRLEIISDARTLKTELFEEKQTMDGDRKQIGQFCHFSEKYDYSKVNLFIYLVLRKW